MKYIAYTDGSSRGNPGRAGWGAIIMNQETVREYSGSSPLATNNQMEIFGAIAVLRFALKHLGQSKNSDGEISIHSDSKYVVDGATSWVYSWVRNNWKTSAKKEVLNKELWIELWTSMSTLKDRGVQVKYVHVRGHSGQVYNERADLLCTDAALGNARDLYSGSRENYKLIIGE